MRHFGWPPTSFFRVDPLGGTRPRRIGSITPKSLREITCSPRQRTAKAADAWITISWAPLVLPCRKSRAPSAQAPPSRAHPFHSSRDGPDPLAPPPPPPPSNPEPLTRVQKGLRWKDAVRVSPPRSSAPRNQGQSRSVRTPDRTTDLNRNRCRRPARANWFPPGGERMGPSRNVGQLVDFLFS